MAEKTEGIKIVIGETDAMVVVDMQNDFFSPRGALYVSGVEGEVGGDELLANTLKLGGFSFGYILTTEDRHPEGHIEETIYSSPHCVEGTVGQEYVFDLRGLYQQANRNLIKGRQKALIAYSAASSYEFAAHIRILRLHNIKRIFVCGLAYTHCVGESAIAFAVQGFETYVVRDATRSVPPPYGDPGVMKQKLALYGVKEITMADIE